MTITELDIIQQHLTNNGIDSIKANRQLSIFGHWARIYRYWGSFVLRDTLNLEDVLVFSVDDPDWTAKLDTGLATLKYRGSAKIKLAFEDPRFAEAGNQCETYDY